MIKAINTKILSGYTAFLAAAFVAADANAQAIRGNDFGNIAENIIESIEELPGLVTGIAYLFGLLMGVLGVIKVKDHVENPTNTPLKDGAIRLAAGGALFALPIVYESMLNTIGITTEFVQPAELNRVDFRVRP